MTTQDIKAINVLSIMAIVAVLKEKQLKKVIKTNSLILLLICWPPSTQ